MTKNIISNKKKVGLFSLHDKVIAVPGGTGVLSSSFVEAIAGAMI